jgi:hypothetical protein
VQGPPGHRERIRIHDKGVLFPAEVGSSGDDSLTLPPMSYRYGDIVSPFLSSDEPLAIEDGHFVECILKGERPLTDGSNGLAVVEVLECAQLSLLLGRPVGVDEIRNGNGNGNGTVKDTSGADHRTAEQHDSNPTLEPVPR